MGRTSKYLKKAVQNESAKHRRAYTRTATLVSIQQSIHVFCGDSKHNHLFIFVPSSPLQNNQLIASQLRVLQTAAACKTRSACDLCSQGFRNLGFRFSMFPRTDSFQNVILSYCDTQESADHLKRRCAPGCLYRGLVMFSRQARAAFPKRV